MFASGFAVLLVCCGVYLVAVAVHQNNLKNEARSVTNLVEQVGTWAAEYKGIWVKSVDNSDVGKALEAFRYTSSSDNEYEDIAAVSYHRKNPVLVQRELSDVSQRSSGKAKFKILSDNPMNPGNQVGPFEKMALEAMRNDGKSEFYESNGGEFRYAKMIKASKSCMACHASAEKAPESVRRNYGTESGYGYKEGDVVGVISVSLENKVTTDAVLSYISWSSVAGLLMMVSALLLLMSFVRAQLGGIVSLQVMTDKLMKGGSEVSNENVENLSRSSNELDLLKGAIFALSHSIKYLQKKKSVSE